MKRLRFWFYSLLIRLLHNELLYYDPFTDVFTIRGQRISGDYFKMLENVTEKGERCELKRIKGDVTFLKI